MEQSNLRKDLIIPRYIEKISPKIIEPIISYKNNLLSVFPIITTINNNNTGIKPFDLSETDRDRYLLSFAGVDNEVLFVNPEVYSPLSMEEGQSTPLGIFVEAVTSSVRGSPTGTGRRRMEYVEGHNRSVLVGQVLFVDKEGRVYRDIDLKGVGYVGSGLYAHEIVVKKPGADHPQGGRYGLVERDTAFPDYDNSEQFLKAGIRTYRILGIVWLKELVVDGKKITLEEAIKEGIIDEDFHPVLEVRGFGTKARVAEALKIKYAAKALKDAKSLVARELGREDMSDQEYLDWFAKTLATNVALMHKNGWYHKYLTNHNITLDCRIVDLDSVCSLKAEIERSRDFYSARVSLEDLLLGIHLRSVSANSSVDFTKDLGELREIYRETYDQVFPEEDRTKYFQAVA